MEKKKEKKVKRGMIFLTISCIMLIISIGVFGYLVKNNTQLDNEVKELEINIDKAKEKISSNEEELEEKESKHEKLKEELKEKIEELSIWEETVEKLNSALQ